MGGSNGYQGAEIPGISPAPARISSLKQVDFDFVQRKRKLGRLIPFLSMEQILEYFFFHFLIINPFSAGYSI